MPAGLLSLVDQLRARGRIAPEDVLAVRRLVFGDVAVTPAEAEALVALDESVRDACPEWRAMYLEALTDFLVRQQEPMGYVDAAKADWLIAALARDGRVRGATELELVIRVLELATDAPASLSAFALGQVRATVLRDGRVGAIEVEQLRRIVFAPAGSGRIALTREEAEVLFDINEAVRGGANDPSWQDLFVRAVANAIMAAAGYTPISREAALAQAAWLEAPAEGVGAFLGGMLASLGGGALRELGEDDDLMEARLAAQERQMRAAEAVTAAEAGWLLDRIGRDGRFDANEIALVRFLAAQSPDLHPSLKPLVERAA